MKAWKRVAQLSGTGLLGVAMIASPSVGQTDSVTWGWTDKAEFSLVFTGGNSSANTFGARNTLVGEGGKSKVALEVGGIRTQSSIRARTATGTSTDFVVSETTETETTAENYFATGRYDYEFSERAFWFGETGWIRNTFSGFDSRLTFVTGLGRIWLDTDQTRLATDVGATYTIQNDVSGSSEQFGGARFRYDLMRALTTNATFESKLLIDANIQNLEDLRGDLVNSVQVSISEDLALKTSFKLLFDNLPSLETVPLVSGGTPTGETVLAELGQFDSLFTVALVINI